MAAEVAYFKPVSYEVTHTVFFDHVNAKAVFPVGMPFTCEFVGAPEADPGCYFYTMIYPNGRVMYERGKVAVDVYFFIAKAYKDGKLLPKERKVQLTCTLKAQKKCEPDVTVHLSEAICWDKMTRSFGPLLSHHRIEGMSGLRDLTLCPYLTKKGYLEFTINAKIRVPLDMYQLRNETIPAWVQRDTTDCKDQEPIYNMAVDACKLIDPTMNFKAFFQNGLYQEDSCTDMVLISKRAHADVDYDTVFVDEAISDDCNEFYVHSVVLSRSSSLINRIMTEIDDLSSPSTSGASGDATGLTRCVVGGGARRTDGPPSKRRKLNSLCAKDPVPASSSNSDDGVWKVKLDFARADCVKAYLNVHYGVCPMMSYWEDQEILRGMSDVADFLEDKKMVDTICAILAADSSRQAADMDLVELADRHDAKWLARRLAHAVSKKCSATDSDGNIRDRKGKKILSEEDLSRAPSSFVTQLAKAQLEPMSYPPM